MFASGAVALFASDSQLNATLSGYIERWNFLLGAIFVAIVILMPEGLVPGTARLWRQGWRAFRRRRSIVIAGSAEPKP